MRSHRVNILGAANGWVAKDGSCEDGPFAVRSYDVIRKLQANGHFVRWAETVYPSRKRADVTSATSVDVVSQLLDFSKTFSKKVSGFIKENKFPVVLGGDHSTSIATWSGVTTALDAENEFGLIWIDSKLDSELPETSTTKRFCHMALPCLLGKGHQQLATVASQEPKFSAKNVVIIGASDMSDVELDFAKSEGITIFTADDVRAQGFENVLDQAIEKANDNDYGFGVSMDLSVFTKEEAPGVEGCNENGLLKADILPALQSTISKHHDFLAFELVGYNPLLDRKNTSLKLVVDILDHALDHEMAENI